MEDYTYQKFSLMVSFEAVLASDIANIDDEFKVLHNELKEEISKVLIKHNCCNIEIE